MTELDDILRKVCEWKPCARCGMSLSPFHNARMVPNVGIVCMPCCENPPKPPPSSGPYR